MHLKYIMNTTGLPTNTKVAVIVHRYLASLVSIILAMVRLQSILTWLIINIP